MYQSNYQLRKMGKNINQLARQFNAGTPPAITTQEIDKWIKYLHFHIGLVNTLLEKRTELKLTPLTTPLSQDNNRAVAFNSAASREKLNTIGK